MNRRQAWTAIRIVLAVILSLLIGGWNGVITFLGVPIWQFVVFLFPPAVAVGALAPRHWYLALLGSWGGLLSGFLYAMSGSLLGLVTMAFVGVPLLLAGGSYLGAALVLRRRRSRAV